MTNSIILGLVLAASMASALPTKCNSNKLVTRTYGDITVVNNNNNKNKKDNIYKATILILLLLLLLLNINL